MKGINSLNFGVNPFIPILLLFSFISAEIYDVSISENDTASYNYADFRMWVDDSTDTLRGIYWFMHPNNGDSRNIVTDSAYQALASGQNFALMGAHIFNMHMNTGIGDAVIAAMDSFAVLFRHDELEFVPFFINGYSWGGQFAYHFTKWIPERIVGFITQKGGYHNADPAGDAIEVPGLMFVGENDLPYRIENLTGIFLDHRPLDAKWILAMEQDAGHSQITDHSFLDSFFNTVTDLRLPDSMDVFQPIILNSLTDSVGWFGDQDTWNIGSFEFYNGIIDSSSWFPSRNVGERWQNFVSEGMVIDISDCENQIWYISPTGSDSTGDGSEQYPFATIQHGIDLSDNGDTVLVYPGIFDEPIDFLEKSIVIGSLYILEENENYIDETILSNSVNIILALDSELNGFTFLNIDLYLEGGPQAVIYIENASPKIINNRFDNLYLFQSVESAIIYCESSNALIMNNEFINGTIGNGDVLGGYILSKNSSVTIKNNRFDNGYVGFAEPAGFIVSVNSENIIESNIMNNPSMGYCYTCAAITILDSSDCIIRNNLILNAIGDGYGAVVASHSQYVSYNNTFVANSFGYANLFSDGIVINDINYGSSNTFYLDESSTIQVSYSDIQGGWAGIGNINSDPLFINPDSGNFNLLESSHCIDAGTPFFAWDGDTLINMMEDEYNGNTPDMGAFESPYTATVSIDDEIIPTEFVLHQPYPNPFNHTTTIRFDLIETRISTELNNNVSLHIFDITGRLVETMLNGKIESGNHEIKWNATQFSSGIYFVELVSGQNRSVQKLVLLK